MDITPINGCVLVELTDVFEHITTPDKKYDTKTSGILVKVDDELAIGMREGHRYGKYHNLIGKKVFFESYKDDTSKEENGKKYALIKAEDLKGFANA